MDSLDTFRNIVRVSKFIERNLENLAKVVDGSEGVGATYHALIADLKKMFPETDPVTLANALITEQCRVEYIKLKQHQASSNFQGRD